MIFSNYYPNRNCFKEREDTFCGNGIVEFNVKTQVSEECDCGFENDCDG